MREIQIEERLQTACARAQRDQRTLALVLLDIDGFKEINDSLGLCENLRDILLRYPALPAQRIFLELVERIALRDISKTSRLISDCQSLGVRFALDDFGTGPAALQYLLELGCNQIKIDNSFVMPMLHSQRHQRRLVR
ncbi:MAG: EAL domain-containing protein [Acidithiobacillus sp.]